MRNQKKYKQEDPVAYFVLGITTLVFVVIGLLILAGLLIVADLENAKPQQQEEIETVYHSEKQNIKTMLASCEVTQDELADEAYYDSLELLAICVEAEAGNQPLDGKRMVVDVILNRVEHPDFPNSIPEVIAQPYHFSSYWDGNMASITEPSEETLKAVQMELEERSYPSLLYFQEGCFSEHGQPWKQVGEHYFSTY